MHGHNVYRTYIENRGKLTIGDILNIVELGFPKDGRYESAKRQILNIFNGFLRDLYMELNREYDVIHNKSETIEFSNSDNSNNWNYEREVKK